VHYCSKDEGLPPHTVTCAFSSTTGRFSSRRRLICRRSHMSPTLCQAYDHSSSLFIAALSSALCLLLPPHCQGLQPPQHTLLTAPLAAPAGLRLPRPPPQTSACLTRQGLQASIGTPLSMCCVCTFTCASELTMYCLDCSDFATLLSPPPFSS
jgi:hypothetical protein